MVPLQVLTSFPLVSPPSNHSTVMLCSSAFTPDITAEWIRPLDRWISTQFQFSFQNGNNNGNGYIHIDIDILSKMLPYNFASVMSLDS